MKKTFLFAIIMILVFLTNNIQNSYAAFARNEVDGVQQDAGTTNITTGFAAPYVALGYTCTQTIDWNGVTIECIKVGVSTYSATQDDTYTLTGFKTTSDDLFADDYMEYSSPFVYFSNPPQGNISLTLNSKFNSYFPIPSFNAYNGWNVIGDKQKGIVSIDGKEQKSLFYELAMNSVTLNRHGQNFTSKEEITSYLQNSDFFDQLSFSQEQKENSLQYVLQKLNDSKVNNKYYYLTILTDESIADISTLAIQPKPKKLIRNYFAIYPTNVSVKTEGSFVFPKKQNLNNKDFVVKETGEFVIPNSMTIFFK